MPTVTHRGRKGERNLRTTLGGLGTQPTASQSGRGGHRAWRKIRDARKASRL